MIKFLTEYIKTDGLLYANRIFATSWEEAEKIAKERGLKEKVIGYIP